MQLATPARLAPHSGQVSDSASIGAALSPTVVPASSTSQMSVSALSSTVVATQPSRFPNPTLSVLPVASARVFTAPAFNDSDDSSIAGGVATLVLAPDSIPSISAPATSDTTSAGANFPEQSYSQFDTAIFEADMSPSVPLNVQSYNIVKLRGLGMDLRLLWDLSWSTQNVSDLMSLELLPLNCRADNSSTSPH